MIDLLIVGGGLAGPVAACIAAEAGLTVRLITQGMGITHWHAGTVDLFGYHPEAGTQAIEEPIKFHKVLKQTAHQHPLAQVDVGTVRSALHVFQQLCAQSDLPYSGSEEEHNLLLPSPVGAPRPAFLVPEAQRAGDLSDNRPMLVLGFDGLRDFYPRLVAQNLTAQGIPARWATLPSSLVSDRRGPSPVEMARQLDDSQAIQDLADAIQRVRQPGERVGLPALLGLDNHRRYFHLLQEMLDTTIFEIPTLPPSVAGIRLFRALRQAMAVRNVEFETGMKVIGFQAKEEQILWVESETSNRPMRHRAAHFLLATGGLLGGGFNSDHTGRVWETIFDLPLTTPQDRRQWFRPLFLDGEGQPVFHGGVAVDSRFQPLNEAGEPVFMNLWAAGTTLAHCDPIRERSLEGLAVVSAYAAVQSLLQKLPST